MTRLGDADWAVPSREVPLPLGEIFWLFPALADQAEHDRVRQLLQAADPVYLIVCLDTGAHLTLTPSVAQSTSDSCLHAFWDPTEVPADDPVRRWLRTEPAAGPVWLLIDTPDRLERYCAAEIVRTDQPERIAGASVDVSPRLGLADAHYLTLTQTKSAGVLPYAVVFGSAIYPVTEVGSRGDVRPKADRAKAVRPRIVLVDQRGTAASPRRCWVALRWPRPEDCVASSTGPLGGVDVTASDWMMERGLASVLRLRFVDYV